MTLPWVYELDTTATSAPATVRVYNLRASIDPAERRPAAKAAGKDDTIWSKRRSRGDQPRLRSSVGRPFRGASENYEIKPLFQQPRMTGKFGRRCRSLQR